MSEETKQNARSIALKILSKVTREGSYSNLAVKDVLKGAELGEADKRLASQIAYGVLENLMYIDHALSAYLREKPDDTLMNILRIGTYQLLFLSKIPESAAVNESVLLCARTGRESKRGFVNAVLRKVSKDKNDILLPDKETQPEKYLSIKYSYPLWLVSKWISEYGYEFAEKMVSYRPRQRGICLVPNPMKISTADWEAYLKNKGLQFEKGEWSPECFYVKGYGDLAADEMFLSGKVSSIGEAAALVARITSPQKGTMVIDACAAPGGKSMLMAQLTGGEAEIIAFDIHPHRVQLVEKNAKRLGYYRITAQLQDAAELKKGLAGRAGAVLVDAPCSGLGVTDSKPDIKLTKSPEAIAELAKLQMQILQTCSKYVAPGGTLVYSTCTIIKEENEEIIKAFLANNPKFEMADLSAYVPEGFDRARLSNGWLQLFPHLDHIDGFFIAKMTRR